MPSVSVLSFGADPTGGADISTALAAALAASNSVVFPPGTYLLTNPVTVAMTGTRQIFITGEAATIVMSGISSGFTFFGMNPNNAVAISGINFQATAAGTVTAIALTGSTTIGAVWSSSTFKDLTFLGSTASNYFAKAIDVSGVSNCFFSGVHIWGARSGGANGIGVQLGTPGGGDIPVEFSFLNCDFIFLGAGIVMGDWVQGLQVANTNFVNNSIGISVPVGAGNTGRDELSITNSQFGIGSGIAISVAGTDLSDLICTGTYFILGDSAFGIQLNHTPGRHSIQGNMFRKAVGTSSATGIQLRGSSASIVSVQDNTFTSDTGVLIAFDLNGVANPNIVADGNVMNSTTGVVTPVAGVNGTLSMSYLMNDYLVSLNYSDAAPPSVASGGFTTSWNRSGGQEEVAFWNLFNNPAKSFRFLHKTGTSTADCPFEIDAQGILVHGMPTSSAGLTSGRCWNNGGAVNIVP